MNLWWRLVRFGFRLLYNEMAFTYDTVSWIVSLGAWRCWQRTSLKHLDVEAGGLVLELAHGTGNLLLDLHTSGCRTVGYDLSAYMGRIARKKLKKHGAPVNLVRGRAQQLPFAALTFSAVVCTFPTDFIITPETLREVHRVIQADGSFVVVAAGILRRGGVAGSFLEWLYRITGQREHSGFDAVTYLADYGFDAEVFQEDCPRSVAHVIVARKTPTHEKD